MKKILLATATIAWLAACNDSKTETSTTSDTAAVATAPTVSADTTMTSSGTTSMSYAAAEGDVRFQNGSVVVYRNGAWVPSTADVTLDNNIVVTKTGKVSGNGKTVVLQDGEYVTKTGNFFDKVGNAISDGWDATKHGVAVAAEKTADAAEAAGHAIKKGAEKVGEKTKEVVNDVKH